MLNTQFLGQPCEIFKAPKLDQAPVKFFVISSSVNDVSVERHSELLKSTMHSLGLLAFCEPDDP